MRFVAFQIVRNYDFCRGDFMNITKFINSHSELNELPFLVVYRTIQILQSMGVVKFTEENENGMG